MWRQGAILGGVIMIYVCKLRGEKKSTVVSVRKDPIGCDETCVTKEIPRKTLQLLEKSGRGSHTKQLKDVAPFEEDPTDMIIDLEDKENDDQVGDVTTNICGDEGGTLIETGGEEIDETEDGLNDDKDDDNQVMPEEVNTAGEEEDTETQPTAGSDIEGEPDLGDVKEDTLEEGDDNKDGHSMDPDRMRHDWEDVKEDTLEEGDDKKDGHSMDPDRMRHEPSGLSGDVDDEEKVEVESPEDDEERMVEGDSLTSLRETVDQVRGEPSLDNDDNIYKCGIEESNAGTHTEECSEFDTSKKRKWRKVKKKQKMMKRRRRTVRLLTMLQLHQWSRERRQPQWEKEGKS
ncbi:coiled-coil domain-containing protein 1-like [Haliotis rufescens]|uniref:coiled-coil domain-containing protein 1-like n=1 Tax=Haliotis rufescens TaxID=6454 RepID=UPI00201F2B8B|nr:coiled-coil domain-containing protein 1-like [Haliotis rufescens]